MGFQDPCFTEERKLKGLWNDVGVKGSVGIIPTVKDETERIQGSRLEQASFIFCFGVSGFQKVTLPEFGIYGFLDLEILLSNVQ